MKVQRLAIGAIALAIVIAEVAHPTHFAPKKIGHATGVTSGGSGLDTNVLDSLPPIDKQALGSIDFLQFDRAGRAIAVTSNVAIPRSATITFIGWCGDPDLKAVGAGAFLSIDGRVRIDVSQYLGNPRPDVVKYYASPGLLDSGFAIRVAAATIGPGTHEIQFGVIARDRRGYFTLGGPIDVTVE